MILLDTSILIDYYRKTDKGKSVLLQLKKDYQQFAVSVVTQFEVYRGVRQDKLPFWNDLFQNMIILPFDADTVSTALILDNDLKKISKQIELADLFIAATAVSRNIPCATLNKKHFERIEKLRIVI